MAEKIEEFVVTSLGIISRLLKRYNALRKK